MFLKNNIIVFYKYENSGNAPLILKIIFLILHYFYKSFSKRLSSLLHRFMHYSVTEPTKVSGVLLPYKC